MDRIISTGTGNTLLLQPVLANLKKFYFVILFLIYSVSNLGAQIFTWKNPNLPQDSIKKDSLYILKKDSILASKLEKDIFQKDTLDFIKTKERIIIDKDSKDKIRKELNTLGFNQSTLFPEIDKVAEYVRDKYK